MLFYFHRCFCKLSRFSSDTVSDSAPSRIVCSHLLFTVITEMNSIQDPFCLTNQYYNFIIEEEFSKTGLNSVIEREHLGINFLIRVSTPIMLALKGSSCAFLSNNVLKYVLKWNSASVACSGQYKGFFLVF